MFKKIFIATILSLVLMFCVFSGEKARAAQWSCYHGSVCQTINANTEALANTDCSASGPSYSVGEGSCLAPAPTAPTPADPGVVKLDNPLSSGTSATSIIAIVIKSALGIIGALTLLMFVLGGFEWLTSAGNPEKVKSGTQTMVWAIIGVILVFASYILLSTFINYLTGTA